MSLLDFCGNVGCEHETTPNCMKKTPVVTIGSLADLYNKVRRFILRPSRGELGTVNIPYGYLLVCLSARVWMSASTSPKLHFQCSPKFLCLLTMVVARTISGGVAIRYVLPVLWIACLHIMATNKRRENGMCSSK